MKLNGRPKILVVLHQEQIETQKWAFGSIGIILGFWLKSG